MIPIFWKYDDRGLPDEDLYYLVARGGVFRVKRNPLYTVSVRVMQPSEQVAQAIAAERVSPDELVSHDESVLLHLPKRLPGKLLERLVRIFRAVWQTHRAEVEAQLYWHEDEERFSFRIPEICAIPGGYFCYFVIPPTPAGAIRLGTIHSHGEAVACQSIVDWHTERENDGLHITIGNVTSPFPTAEARIVADGVTFTIPIELVAEAPADIRMPRLPKLHLVDPKKVYPEGSFEAEALAAYQGAWEAPTIELVGSQEEPMAETAVIIGLGGIGGALARTLAWYLDFHEPGSRLILVDGKAFEPRKADRQQFHRLGNKARVLADELREEFERLYIQAVPQFVTADNVAQLIQSGAAVFLAPDNHETRRLVAEHAARLSDILLIAGGNEGLDDGGDGVTGTVLVHLRRGGQDLTAPITEYHPEIAEAAGPLPNDPSCALQARSVRQLLFTNQTAAQHMLNTYYAARRQRLRYGELWFNIETGEVTTYERPPGSSGRSREDETEET